MQRGWALLSWSKTLPQSDDSGLYLPVLTLPRSAASFRVLNTNGGHKVFFGPPSKKDILFACACPCEKSLLPWNKKNNQYCFSLLRFWSWRKLISPFTLLQKEKNSTVIVVFLLWLVLTKTAATLLKVSMYFWQW